MKDLNLDIFPRRDLLTQNEISQKNQIVTNDFGLNIKPYYTKADIEPYKNHLLYFEKLPPFQWRFYENITVCDEKKANQKALEVLNLGADGVIFERNVVSNFSVLCKDIDISACEISLLLKQHPEAEIQLNGMIETPKEKNRLVANQNVLPIQQLASILSSLHKQKYIVRTAFQDFCFEIAYLRALHYLLYRAKKTQIKIHTYIPQIDEKHQQSFLNTTACLATIMGGSHSIAFQTSAEVDYMNRNIGNIIREECGITAWENQVGGAYYIEALTGELINKVSSKL